jgi:hypothetical protein
MNEKQNRLIHDAAWTCASSIMDSINMVFMPAEVRDAHELIYQNVRAAIEAAFIMRTRENARLKPSCN